MTAGLQITAALAVVLAPLGAAGQDRRPLDVSSTASSIDVEALIDALAVRLTDFEVRAVPPGSGDPAAVRLLVARGDDDESTVLTLFPPEGPAIERRLLLDSRLPDDLRLRVVAVAASHLVVEPEAPPPVVEPGPAPVPEPVEPGPVEPVEPAFPAVPGVIAASPGYALGLSLTPGVMGNVTGVSAGGDGLGPVLLAGVSWAQLDWIALALESGWSGVWSDRVADPMSIVPVRLGADVHRDAGIVRVALGPRLAVDFWTADYQKRETGVQIGFSARLLVEVFPWERFGFVGSASVGAFPEAVLLRVGGAGAFALGRVRFLAALGVAARL